MSRVRPFIMTGGRTRAERRDLRVETLLQSSSTEIPETLNTEQVEILRACVQPISKRAACSGVLA